jgi:predicted RNase H-like nuclease (RuvC/YqgF family)
MRKLFTIILTLISITMFSQVTQQIKYPRFEKDSLGQKVVIMTIPQAMKLNNNSNILEKFEKLQAEMQDYENICIKVIDEKDKVIAKLDVVITKQDGQLVVKDEKIKALQGEILGWMEKNHVLETQLANRQQVIDEKDKQLRRLKTKMVITGVGGSVVIVGLLLSVLGVF